MHKKLDEKKLAESAANAESKPTLPTSSTGKESVFQVVIRGPCYLMGLILLVCVTTLILISLSTNNWETTYSKQSSSEEWFTYGLWYKCRYVKASWINNLDVYCAPLDYALYNWIHAAQVFYTLGAALNLFSLGASIFGLCRDVGTNIATIPSLVFWAVLASCVSQLIAICVYGAKSIYFYPNFRPDYSIIVASVALGLDFVCFLLFLVELMIKSKKKKQVNQRRRTVRR